MRNDKPGKRSLILCLVHFDELPKRGVKVMVRSGAKVAGFD